MNISRPINPVILSLGVIFTLQSDRSTAEEVTWSQVFSPNRIAEIFLQYGIQAARGFADITYQDLAVDALRSNASIRNVKIWPIPDWEGSDDCVVSIERLDLSGSALTSIDKLSGELVIQGLTAPLVCLPSQMRIPVVAAGQDSIQVDLLRSRFDYNMPKNSLTAQTVVRVPNFAMIELSADIQYLSYWLRDNQENYPIVYLNDAQLKVENLGGWEALKPVLPPTLTDPDSADEAFGRMIKGFLAAEFGNTQPLTEDQSDFLKEAELAWVDFVADPSQLTLSVLDNVDNSQFINFNAIRMGEVDAVSLLQPRISSGRQHVMSILTSDVISSAQTDSLASGERLKIANALISGEGVPRNISLGEKILTELASAGDPSAQEALADLLSESDLERSYTLAVAAAESGSRNAVLLLDHLESKMSWRTVLRLQSATAFNDASDTVSEADVSQFRTAAAASLHGDDAPRNYARAMYWALLGSALGDQESKWIIEEVERRVGSFDDSDLREFSRPIEDAALEYWLQNQGPTSERDH